MSKLFYRFRKTRSIFELKNKGVNIEYKTKLNSPELSQIINDILKKL